MCGIVTSTLQGQIKTIVQDIDYPNFRLIRAKDSVQKTLTHELYFLKPATAPTTLCQGYFYPNANPTRKQYKLPFSLYDEVVDTVDGNGTVQIHGDVLSAPLLTNVGLAFVG